MPLSDTACRTAKPDSKPRKLADGGGLYLFISTGGTKSWRLDYQIENRRKTLTIGRYPDITLASARQERDKAKAMIRAGRDPSTKSAGTTFETFARTWFEANRHNWKTSYSTRMWTRIEENILPAIGSREIASIEPHEILSLLRQVEDRGAVYTAKRVNQLIISIFRYAIADSANSGCKFNPASELSEALKSNPKVKHRTFLREGQLREFFERLRDYREEPTRLALEMVAHTFVRTDEIRLARWEEFGDDVWRIPGPRMKMGAEHMVPLTPRVKEIVARLRVLAGNSEWVLPGPFMARDKPISNNTLLYALYRLGYNKVATVHGFRRTASTILNESGQFHPDWIERQLAHVPEDKVRSAYNAAEYWPHRVAMMHWYSERLEKHRLGKVTDLTGLLE